MFGVFFDHKSEEPESLEHKGSLNQWGQDSAKAKTTYALRPVALATGSPPYGMMS